MPSRKSTNAESAKETRAQSPDSLPDLTDLSAPQSSVDPPVIEVSPPQQNYKEPKAQTAPPQEQPNTHVPQTSNTAEPESNSARIKRKLKEDEEAYAVCRYCGYTSTNVDYCEGCQRKLPMDVKVCIKKRRSAGDGSDLFPGSGDEKAENLPGAVDKKSFYGNKLKTQAAAFKNKISEFAKEFDVKPKKPQRGRKPGTTPRNIGRGRKIREMLEPVTVILSSDEDEVSKTDGTPQQQSSNTSGSISVTSQHDDDEMPFFPAQSAKPTAFGKSRRERMQDEAGRCVSAKNPMVTDGLQVVQPNRNLIEVRGVRVGSMRSSGHTVDLMPNVIHFDVNSDRTGEDLQFEVFLAEVEWIKFTLSQMQPVCFIKVSPACGSRLRERLKMSLQTQEYFDPGSQDPKKSLIVVIIETILNEDGLRKRLSDYKKMHSGVPGFLEELDFDEANNMLVKSTPPVLNNVESSHQLRRFHKQKNSCQATSSPSTISIPSSQCSGDFGDSSVLEDSMDMGMVAQTAGDAGAESPCSSNKEEPMPSRSPSPKIGFVGPVEKLLTYPPPPAKGGITITNEDLYCLNEGEFLNDVILDFYLKYLFREKLSEEDRQRTHIFSSFFYKRLMQRQSRSLQDAEDVKLTPAQRRHSRVKTWTRHVDIFEKDFLLIPINEHSHWFLAVICFPGLEKQERQMFEPAGPSLDESLNDSSNENGNIKLSASPSWQEDTASPAVDESKEEPMDTGDAPSSKAILGSVIQNHEESKSFTTGVKQACILILDSLAGPSRNGIIKILKEYLQIEWDLKKKTPRTVTKTVRGGVPRVPQQTNYSDCGVFVLQYAESFFENPVCDFSIPMKGLSKWFPLSKVQKKRDEIRKLILDLHGEAS
nr:hypothetical protein BaRGS_004205 [Batillaria attramentaria]